jgi:hypothetical protein
MRLKTEFHLRKKYLILLLQQKTTEILTKSNHHNKNTGENLPQKY